MFLKRMPETRQWARGKEADKVGEVPTSQSSKMVYFVIFAMAYRRPECDITAAGRHLDDMERRISKYNHGSLFERMVREE